MASAGTPVELKWQYADGDAIDLANPADVIILKKMAYTNLISGLPYVLLRCCIADEEWNMLKIQSKMTSISLPAPDGGYVFDVCVCVKMGRCSRPIFWTDASFHYMCTQYIISKKSQ